MTENNTGNPGSVRSSALAHPEHLHVMTAESECFYGCEQAWFGTEWQQRAGCGPSVASNIMLYLHQGGKLHLPYDLPNQAGCLQLMEAMWGSCHTDPHGGEHGSALFRRPSCLCGKAWIQARLRRTSVSETVGKPSVVPGSIGFSCGRTFPRLPHRFFESEQWGCRKPGCMALGHHCATGCGRGRRARLCRNI